MAENARALALTFSLALAGAATTARAQAELNPNQIVGEVAFTNSNPVIVGDRIYANVWNQDRIVAIDPGTGTVTAVIDATGLLPPPRRARVDVLNGIAWDPTSETFWITGKYWPTMFQVRFVPTGSSGNTG